MKPTFVAVILALAFSPAAANPILEPYAPFKLVGVMPDTGQALLWDEKAAEYRLARKGDDLEGWRVGGLDTSDVRGPRLALQKEDLIDELELVRLPRPGSVMVFKSRAMTTTQAAPPTSLPSIAPTVIAAPRPAPGAPPAAAPAPPAAASPPAAPPGHPQLLDEEPYDEEPYDDAPLEPAWQEEAPAAPAAPEAPAAPAILEETRSLTRAELDRELNDFDRLMASVSVEGAPDGGFVLVRLDPRSWLARLGFREGDIVRSVAGERVSSIEDAARVYARLRSLRSFAAEVDRGPTRVHLRFDIRPGSAS
jgi:hypothetical protein